jgi:hypothetical protein
MGANYGPTSQLRAKKNKMGNFGLFLWATFASFVGNFGLLNLFLFFFFLRSCPLLHSLFFSFSDYKFTALFLSRTSDTLQTVCDGPDLAREKDGDREIEPKCKWRRKWSRLRSALMEIRQKTSGYAMDSRG